MNLTAGPQKKICQPIAIGKLMTAVCSQVPIKPAAWKFLKRTVAIKLMVEHIRQTEIQKEMPF